MKLSCLFLCFLFLFGCGGSEQVREQNVDYYDGMDCGPVESVFGNGGLSPYKVVIGFEADENALKAINGAMDRWNNALGEVLLSQATGEAELTLVITPTICPDSLGCYAVGLQQIKVHPAAVWSEGVWLHEFGHALGLGHACGEALDHSNFAEVFETASECCKHSTMFGGEYITAHAIEIVRQNFGL